MNKRSKGFTLVEVICVIAILGILASISTVAVFKIRAKQEVKNRENVISSILTGAKVYNAEHMGATSISVQDLINGDYVDFDTTKYSDLVSKTVIKEICTNTLKSKYIIDTYNDCGCEDQESDVKADTICSDKKNTN